MDRGHILGVFFSQKHLVTLIVCLLCYDLSDHFGRWHISCFCISKDRATKTHFVASVS
jgi:hypothetical protein